MNQQAMQTQLWCKATLQYPTVNQLPLESVGDMLAKATNLVGTANFQWSYIDKPADGSIYLVYMQSGAPAPPDGFMYMDNEQPYTMNIQGKMIEIWEHKYGFIPGQEAITSRSRRRFRLGGKAPSDISTSLWLLFYSRTDENTRVQANPIQARPQPIRKYPLPTLNTKPFNLFSAIPGQAMVPGYNQQLQQQYQMQQMQLQAQQAMKAQAQKTPVAVNPRLLPQQLQQGGFQAQHGVPMSPYPPGMSVPPNVAAQYASPASIQQIPQKRPYMGSGHQQLPQQVVNQLRPGETLAEPPVQFEEATGDEFDDITPMDISKARFMKHHDWMEEILSMYPTSKIVPPPLFSQDPESKLPDKATLERQIKATEEAIAAMKAKHEEVQAEVKVPSSRRQQALIAGLTRLEQPNLDDATLDAIVSEVGLPVEAWQAVRAVPIASRP